MPYDAPTCAAEDAIEAALNELRLASYERGLIAFALRQTATGPDHVRLAHMEERVCIIAERIADLNARIDAATAILSGYFERPVAVAVAVEG